VVGRQPPDEGLEPADVVVDHEPAVDVGGDVVPGGDDPAVLAFCGIPRGRDVGIRAAHDDQRLAEGGCPPVLVVPGDVADQRAVFADVRPAPGRVVQERQHGGQQPVLRRGDEVGGALLAEELQDGRVVGLEVSRDVHLGASKLG